MNCHGIRPVRRGLRHKGTPLAPARGIAGHWLSPRRARKGRAMSALAALAAVAAVLAPAVAAQDDSGTFSDDDGAYYEAPFETLAARGVLDGTECAPGRICPSDPIKRQTMAVWLGRVLSDGEPDEVASTRFSDVDASQWWAAHIERFAELGVTAGCATDPLRYCPHETVTRGQLAAFLVRAFDLADAYTAGFTDTAGTSFEDEINSLAAAGVTAGCATDPLRYCPHGSVTRGQMATFLARATTMPSESEGPPSVRLVFHIQNDDHQQIAVIDENGEILTLTDDQTSSTVHLSRSGFRSDHVAAWSPDGTRILYSSGADSDHQDLFVMKPDGTDRVQLSNEGYSYIGDVSWSPDGLQVAYIGVRVLTVDNYSSGSVDLELTVVDATGSNPRRIRLTNPDFDTDGMSPGNTGGMSPGHMDGYRDIRSWAPDKTAIVLRWSGPSGFKIPILVHIDGQQITNVGLGPSWSPSGTQFTYARAAPGLVSDGCVLANADGTDKTILVTSGYCGSAWSPDGAHIAYHQDDGGLFVAEADGTNPTRISDNIRVWDEWEWSPDGAHIAYHQDDGGLFVAEADGTNPTRISDNIKEWEGWEWSPDGAHIAYRPDDGGLFVAEADGTNPTRISDNIRERDGWEWSPDGAHIAYRQDDGGLFVAEADGTNPTRISDNIREWEGWEWSPDGAHIAYRQDDGGLFVAEADGTNPTRISDNGLLREWSPDSAGIVYSRSADGVRQVFAVNADGTNSRQLPSGTLFTPRLSESPWSPDGSHLRYFVNDNSDPVETRYIIETAAGAPVLDIDLTDAKAHFTSGPPFAGWAKWGPSGIYGALDWRWSQGGG